MFSHGFVGLALYVAWLITAMYQAARYKDPVSLMLASVVYVGALQMFFYSMFSGSLAMILIAIGLLGRSASTATDTRMTSQLRVSNPRHVEVSG
jgi:hypothetical protein